MVLSAEDVAIYSSYLLKSQDIASCICAYTEAIFLNWEFKSQILKAPSPPHVAKTFP